MYQISTNSWRTWYARYDRDNLQSWLTRLQPEPAHSAEGLNSRRKPTQMTLHLYSHTLSRLPHHSAIQHFLLLYFMDSVHVFLLSLSCFFMKFNFKEISLRISSIYVWVSELKQTTPGANKINHTKDHAVINGSGKKKNTVPVHKLILAFFKCSNSDPGHRTLVSVVIFFEISL